MHYYMSNHFLCSCEWQYSCGDHKVFCSRLVMCKHRFCNAHCCMANHFVLLWLMSMIASVIWTMSLQ